MESPNRIILDFLESWKPFAEMGPGHPTRRGITRFLEAEDRRQREAVMNKTIPLFQLQSHYTLLGIRKVDRQDKSDRFEELLKMPLEKMAQLIQSEERREILGLLQECYEFGREATPSKTYAIREFLIHFWAMPVAATALKYTLYPNGVFFTNPGSTHDEMASKFNKMGLGSGRPQGGGEILRRETLLYLFDTATKAFGGFMKPNVVEESLRRWLRLSGCDEEKLTLRYVEKLGAK